MVSAYEQEVEFLDARYKNRNWEDMATTIGMFVCLPACGDTFSIKGRRCWDGWGC
jgi:hypothetical protein